MVWREITTAGQVAFPLHIVSPSREPEADTALLEEIVEVLTSARETAQNLRVGEEVAARLRTDGDDGREWLKKLHACSREITGSYRVA